MQPISCASRLFFIYLHDIKRKFMKFVRTIPGYNHLWAVRDEDQETDELSLLFRQ